MSYEWFIFLAFECNQLTTEVQNAVYDGRSGQQETDVLLEHQAQRAFGLFSRRTNMTCQGRATITRDKCSNFAIIWLDIQNAETIKAGCPMTRVHKFVQHMLDDHKH